MSTKIHAPRPTSLDKLVHGDWFISMESGTLYRAVHNYQDGALDILDAHRGTIMARNSAHRLELEESKTLYLADVAIRVDLRAEETKP